MNYRKIVNWGLLCVGGGIIFAGHFLDMSELHRVGDILFFFGVIMLPKTASIDRRNARDKKGADDMSS